MTPKIVLVVVASLWPTTKDQQLTADFYDARPANGSRAILRANLIAVDKRR
jgi:hypothetical protein